MPRKQLLILATACCALAGCGGSTKLGGSGPSVSGVQGKTPQAGQRLGFPAVATKNTTRVAGGDPVADAAGVALAVYPSQTSGTHPAAVTIAPTDDWQAALAASVLMAPPIRAPVLLSGSSGLPSATADALALLAPGGSGAAGGAQVILVGDVAKPSGLHSVSIGGSDPYVLAAGIDRFAGTAAGRASADVMIASADAPSYAMPAAGLAAESGDPILFVSSSGVPNATRQALLSHGKPNIYVVGPPSVVPNSVVTQLSRYGAVKRVSGPDPTSNSIAFATYRDPPCRPGPCAQVPGSFGWAIPSPGHGYVLLNAGRPLDAAAAAPLSSSGSYGPDLVATNSSRLQSSLCNFFLDYEPGYTQQGQTLAVYDHAWLIGDQSALSVGIQAQVDQLLEAVPVSQTSKGPSC